MRSRLAKQAGHIFVARVDGRTDAGFLSTHPPLTERIRHLGVDREKLKIRKKKIAERTDPGAEKLSVERFFPSDTSHVVVGATLLGALPQATVNAARELTGALAVVTGLILSQDEETQELQREEIEKAWGEPIPIREKGLPTKRTPQSIALYDVALSTLTLMPRDRYESLREALLGSLTKSQVVDIGGFALASGFVDHLDRAVLGNLPTSVQFRKRDDVLPAARVILAELSRRGADHPEDALQSYRDGIFSFTGSHEAELAQGRCDYGVIRRAFLDLGASSFHIKEGFLHACLVTIQHDGMITGDEAAILRGIASAMQLPLPPFLPREGKASALGEEQPVL